jgi:hypothetical protein
MSVDIGEAVEKIKGRPPIEYLRKLAPSPEEAQRYLKSMEKAKLVKLSELGALPHLDDVYVPAMDAILGYGMPGLNEIIEWQEAGFMKDLEKLDGLQQMKAFRKLAYLLIRKADPTVTEEQVGQMDAAAVTQFIIAASDHTPFLGTPPPAAKQNPSTPKS